MPTDGWRPPAYISPIGRGYSISVPIVQAALEHWWQVEQNGSPSFRRAARRQRKLCERMLAVAEGKEMIN
jgi:hypothetical protein